MSADNKKVKEKIKIHYFDNRGRAELARFILLYAGVEFEDFRFSKEQWLNGDRIIPYRLYKTKQVPLLEVIQGNKKWTLTQSMAIARYLARRFGLTGASDREKAECDEVVDILLDLIQVAMRKFSIPAENRLARCELYQRLFTAEFPRTLGYLENRVKNTGHVVGFNWTWADFAIHWTIRGLCYMLTTSGDVIANDYPCLFNLAMQVEQIPPIAQYCLKYPMK